MAKQNNIFLYGIIEKPPKIIKNLETDEYIQGIVYIHTVRSIRNAHDGKRYIKHDHPLVIAQTPKCIEEMATWKENDLVHIKGSIFSKRIKKKTYCPKCKSVNEKEGLLSYVTPIFAKKVTEEDNIDDALKNLLKNREVSNQAILVGNLLNDPSCYQTEAGTIITQYQMISNRKVHLKADDPDVKSDVIWAKSYGSQAIEDRLRLTRGSVVILDGYLQARMVNRKTKCNNCDYFYSWTDQMLEIVPFDTEYLQGTFKTDEILEQETHTPIDVLKANIKEKIEWDKDRFNNNEELNSIESSVF